MSQTNTGFVQLTKKQRDWQQRLVDTPTFLQLPRFFPPAGGRAATGMLRRRAFSLPQSLSEALNECSQESEGLKSTLLTAFSTLLFRISGQTNMLLGLLDAKEAKSEQADLLAKTLVLPVTLSASSEGGPSDTFEEFHVRLQRVMVEAQQYQALPFAELVERLGGLDAQRSTSHHPRVQVMFVWQETPNAPILPAEATVSHLDTPFELTLEMGWRGSELIGNWLYRTDLFDEAAIERMTGHLQTLLAGVVTNSFESIERLPLLTEAERQLMLVEWNDTAVDHPLDQAVHEIFATQAAHTPDAVAVVCGDAHLTYRELNEQANQLAHHLIDLGVGPEKLVGVFVERSLEVVVVMLAIFKAGAGYLPLDPTYPIERLAFMLEDTQASLLLTQTEEKSQWLANLPPHQAKVVCLEREQELIAQRSLENPSCHVAGEQLAYIIYTSGSTGKPKGVAVEHRSLTNMTQNDIVYLNLSAEDRLTQFFSLSFDASIAEILCPICAGSRLYLLTEEQVLHGPALLELLKTEAITHLFLTPSILATLSEASDENWPALKALFAAGEACTPDLVKQWSTNRKFYNIYGPTEFTIAATIYECHIDDDPPPIGKPYDNCQAYVLDQHLQPVPIGVTGELYLGGVQVARGYLNRPKLTAEKFISNPFGAGKLYKTGDLVYYRADGNLVFVGRVDQMVKVRGLRIELGEIEARLNEHPAVQQAVVETYKDASGRDQHLVAYILPVSNARLTSGELNDFAREKLPAFMLPSAFVFLSAFPLTASGKVNRRALPTPNMDRLESAGRTNLTAPRTATEKTMADIWCQLLELEEIGIHENFFDLGGHSIMATQIAIRIEKAFGIQLEVRAIFEQHTIAQLADLVEAKMIEQADDALLAQLLAQVEGLP